MRIYVKRFHKGEHMVTRSVFFKRSVFATLVAAFAFSLAVPAHAAGGQRGIVDGTIRDGSGQPVAGAKVTLTAPTGRYSATSNGNGRFHLIAVDVATYDVRVRKDGFADAVLPGVDALGDQTQDLGTITLTPSRTKAAASSGV
jgi:hypothetical protein